MLEVPPSQDSEFTLWGRVLIDFCLELANVSATLCCKQFPYWNPKKNHSLVVWEIMAFNHCQGGIFPEDSETASLWWSQAAFLDVDCDGNTSQFWSTSSTGLGCITMYPCPPAIFDHHFPLVSWGPGIYLYTATSCGCGLMCQEMSRVIWLACCLLFKAEAQKYWSPVIVNLTTTRWVTFQKGTQISCPK